jgi:hypothetical protein
MLTSIELFTRRLFADPDCVSDGATTPILDVSMGEKCLDQLAIRSRHRGGGVYISSALMNLVLNNRVYLPDQAPLFWGVEEVLTILQLTKLEGFFPLM